MLVIIATLQVSSTHGTGAATLYVQEDWVKDRFVVTIKRLCSQHKLSGGQEAWTCSKLGDALNFIAIEAELILTGKV